MSREITLEEVKRGDKIRITREITVAAAIFGLQPGIQASDGRTYFAKEATIELLDRPIDLPTKKGSVIRVHTRHRGGAGSNEGTWILTQNPSGQSPEWVSASRVHLSPDEFKEFLVETPLRTFEVIG